MTDQIKTVNEIMEMVRHVIALTCDEQYIRADGVCDEVRAAITGLHTAATRKAEQGIMSEKDERFEKCVSP